MQQLLLSEVKVSSFKIQEFLSSDGASVKDYFKRLNLALELTNISTDQHANFTRGYMGTQLNNALKFLIFLQIPRIVPLNK